MKSILMSPEKIIEHLQLQRAPQGKRPRWQWYALAAILLLVGFGIYLHNKHATAAAKSHSGGQVISVASAQVRKGDIPVYLDGLGSVTPYNMVTVHSRVDGQLVSVNFREGQEVHAGDLLAQIDPRQFQAQTDQAEGQLAKDQALLTDAKLDLERYQGLLAQQAIPKQQLDTQVATVGQDEGTVKTDQASLEAAKLQLSYCRLTAPISGRVGLRLVDAGNIIHASDPNGLVVITQLQPISVIFTLPEDNLPSVMQKLSGKETLSVAAFNRDKTKQLADGKLVTVDNEIDPTSGTSKLKAVFDNKDNTLLANQFVNVRLLLETRKDQAIVPTVAIQRGSQGTFVYIIKEDSTVDVRPVTVGIIEGNDTSIDMGVNVGENVVIDGADKLQPGSKVNVASPSGNAGLDSAVEHGSKHRKHSSS